MNKTVLITGASTGIGRATAEYFQAMGWNVAATMRAPESEKELNLLERVQCIPLDVTDEGSIDQAIKLTLGYFGGLDVLVNNAGYGAVGPFESATSEQIKRQFDTNVFGLMNVTRAVLPYFRDRHAGVIVSISSMGGRITFPLYSLYHSTKWAVEGFSEALQFELRPFGIRVRLVEPGPISTDFYGRSQDLLNQKTLNIYNEYVDLVMPNLQEAGARGEGPEQVAAVIYKAATATNSRLRYPVGSPAPFLLWLRGKIPTHWFFRLIQSAVEKRKDRLAKYKDSG